MSIKFCSKNTTHSFNISLLSFPERRHGTCRKEYGVNRSDAREGRGCARHLVRILHPGTPRLPRAPPAHQTSIVSVQKTVNIISRTGLLNHVQAPNFKRYKLPQLLHYIM